MAARLSSGVDRRARTVEIDRDAESSIVHPKDSSSVGNRRLTHRQTGTNARRERVGEGVGDRLLRLAFTKFTLTPGIGVVRRKYTVLHEWREDQCLQVCCLVRTEKCERE